MANDVADLLRRGIVSRDAYRAFLRKFNPRFDAQAAPAESKDGKTAKPPLDIRPPAARNQPKPEFSEAETRDQAKTDQAKPKRRKAAAPRAGALNPPTLGIRG